MTEQLITPTETLAPIWTTAVETVQAFAPFYRERTTAAMRHAPPHWFYIVIAAADKPRPLTIDRLQKLFPYNDRRALAETLQPHVDKGNLQPASGNGSADDAPGYLPTEQGIKLVQGFFSAAHEALGDVTPLPPQGMARLRDLLQRVVGNVRSPLPPEHSMSHVGRWTDPGPQAGLAAQIDQYLTDLTYFRDDAHVAAWRPAGLDGVAWDALTVVWRDRAHTAVKLAEELSGRMVPAEDYEAALLELAQRSLISLDGDRASITEQGVRLREEAEERTDRIFFTPWQALDARQLEELHTLLQQARDNLKYDARVRMWPLMVDVAVAMQPLVREPVQAALQERLETPILFNQLRFAREAQPEPYTIQRFLTRFPYASPRRAKSLLSQAVEAGYAEQIDEDAYILTPAGEAIVDAVNDVFYAALGQIEALPDDDMARLNELLDRLVQAALNSDAPSKERIGMTYNTARPRDYAPLARVDLHLDDLNAFRDDAHTSVWAGYFVSGRDWETLTLVWRGDAANAVELAEKLPFRSWEVDDYQTSLDALVARGWLQAQDGAYIVTAAGAALRQSVEEATDERFYGFWDEALTAREQDELRTLLIRLKVQLESLAQPAGET